MRTRLSRICRAFSCAGCFSVADLEWKITYVGSAEDDRYDQVLDSVLVGPVTPGPFRFVFQARAAPCVAMSALARRGGACGRCAGSSAKVLHGTLAELGAHAVRQADPPKWQNIPQDDILGVTVILLTCAYNGQEFIRVGYYVNNEYADEALREAPPASVDIERVARNILAEKPRVTRFPCAFDSPTLPPSEEFGGHGAEGVTTAGFDNGGQGFGYAMPAMGMMETSQDGMLGQAMMV